jgi:hypothetical protein
MEMIGVRNTIRVAELIASIERSEKGVEID